MKRLDKKMFKFAIAALSIEAVGLVADIEPVANAGLIACTTASVLWILIRMDLLEG